MVVVSRWWMVCAVLSQSAITQDALRRARGAVGDAYHRLRESVRESAVVHSPH